MENRLFEKCKLDFLKFPEKRNIDCLKHVKSIFDILRIFPKVDTNENNYVHSLVNHAVTQDMVTDEVLPDQENQDGMENQNGQAQHDSQKYS